MHQAIMNSLVILVVVGAGLQLTVSAETAREELQGRYTKPVVYTNLPPPVLYFPNFPEKQKISERGDADDKRVEYMPFPFKDLPLLVYQSDNQPPVHVVQQKAEAGANKPMTPQPAGNDGKSSQQSGSVAYMQSNGQQYQNIQGSGQQYQNVQMGPVQQQSTNLPAQDTFPDLQNHQFISIGLSAIPDYMGNLVYPGPQPAANPESQFQQASNSQSYGGQNANQYPQQMEQKAANQAPPAQTQQYYVRQNGEQQNSQSPMQYSAQSGQQSQSPMQYSVQSGQQSQSPMQYSVQSGQQNSPSPMQYLVQSGQQSSNSYQNSNNKVSPQTQQNMNSQYSQGAPMQYQSPMQRPMPSVGSQMQQEQGYSKQNQAQMQYTQKNQQDNVAYQQQNQNTQQKPYNAMQQAFYQQAGDSNANVNSLQHLGIAISTVQAPTLRNQQQVVGNKAMGQNMYQRNRQNQQLQPEPQMESSDEDDSEKNDPQYIRIAVYPYGAIDQNQVQQPEQFYKIAIPQPNDEDDDENEKNGGTVNPMADNRGKTQQVTSQNQGYGYRGSPSLGGQNLNPQRPSYSNSNQQRLPPKLNAGNMYTQQRIKEQTQKQPQQNLPQNQIQEEPEYQQILIHIPHSVASSPQILVQPDSNDQPTYMDSVQVQQRRKPSFASKLNPQPQFSSSNNDYQAADYMHPGSSITFNQRPARPKVFPRFPPANYVSAASSNYPSNLFRIPFGHNPGRYADKAILPIGSAHPELYESSNLHFASANPMFVPNPMRNLHRIPFNQVSASMLRPQFLSSPSIPLNNMFNYPDEMMAQASFQRITRSRKDDLNSTETDIGDNGFLNTDSSSESERILKSLAEKSTEALLKQIAKDVQTHDILDGVLGTSSPKQPGVAAFNMPQLTNLLKFNHGGHVPNVPFLPMPLQSFQNLPQSQNGGKYGNFMKKLSALSNSLIYQSLGLKQPVSFREGTKVKDHGDEYSIEETIESLLPENASPRATTIKTDRIGTSFPQKELSKRVLKNKSAKPPIIVYKGPKPPVEVYGSKDDIESRKENDSLEASKQKATSRVGDDVAEVNPEKVFDYVDIMYSMLPDFIKHTIGQFSDDELTSAWLSEFTSEPKSNPKEETASDSQIAPSISDVKSTNSSAESSSAFKEDIEELAKLLHKEEKSDLVPF